MQRKSLRLDWVGRVINWEFRKKLKFDHTKEWYMQNPASVLENDTHKRVLGFKIHTDHLISARRPDLKIIKKKKKKEKKEEKREVAKLWTLLSRLTIE